MKFRTRRSTQVIEAAITKALLIQDDELAKDDVYGAGVLTIFISYKQRWWQRHARLDELFFRLPGEVDKTLLGEVEKERVVTIAKAVAGE